MLSNEPRVTTNVAQWGYNELYNNNIDLVWSIWNSWNDCSLDCTDSVNVERYLVGTQNRTRDCMVCPYDEFLCRKPYNQTICEDLWEANPDGGTQILPCKCDELELPMYNETTEGSGSGGGELDSETSDIIVEIKESSYSTYVHSMLDGYKEDNITDYIKIIAYPELSTASWALWAPWGKCSSTCGKGIRTRYRPCTAGDIDDPGCGFKGSYQDKECLIRVCRPEWQVWEQWTSCSATCGPGVKSRIRYCNSEKKLGQPGCKIENRGETVACINGECIKWRQWESWTACSASCGQGLQARSRICDSDKARHCPGPNVEPRDCFVPLSKCQDNIPPETWLPAEMLDFDLNSFIDPDLDYFTATTASTFLLETTPYNIAFYTTADPDIQLEFIGGYWGEWQQWSPCSLTCTDPFSRKLRRRQCINGNAGDNGCPFIDEVESTICTINDCDDKRDFSTVIMESLTTLMLSTVASPPEPTTVPWNHHMLSTVSEIQTATKPIVDLESFTTIPDIYDYDGGWETWAPWVSCTRTCGEGHRERARVCSSKSSSCVGGGVQREECDLGKCAEMTGWTQWTLCSSSCGKGSLRMRQNSCRQISWNGDLCSEVKNMTEVLEEKQSCSESECPRWGMWSIWSVCDYDGPCPNKGLRDRTRTCHFGNPGDLGCIGNLTEEESCRHSGCAYWAEWQEWTDCEKTCGSGERYRERACSNGVLGNVGCPVDQFSAVENCNTDPCPKWSLWSSWSRCEHECGNSTSIRNRLCIGAPFGDKGCPGLAEKTKPCLSKCTHEKTCDGTMCECWEEAGWISAGSEADAPPGTCIRVLPCMECADVAICNTNELTCQCPNGYEGDGYRCFDMDECQLQVHNCETKADCKNTIGSYHCECPNGYMSNFDTSKCVDIDECSIKMHNCHEPEDWSATPLETRMQLGLFSSFCINTVGSFKCECNMPGFVGNGTFCEQISPGVLAAFRSASDSPVNGEYTLDLDTCSSSQGSLNYTFLLSGKAPFEISVETVQTPYRVNSLQNIVMEKPYQVRLRVDGIPSEPMFADEEIYVLKISDYQYALNFEDGDVPIQAQTITHINLRISNRHCSRLLAEIPSHVEAVSKYLHYGASIILFNFDRNHPMMGNMLTSLLYIGDSFLRSDFRFISIDISAVRVILKNELMPNSTAIDFILKFEVDDSSLDMKPIPTVIQDCLDYFETYLVEEYKIRRKKINHTIKWNHNRQAYGLTFILTACVMGLVAIALSSFTSFCNWSDNFMALGSNGRLGPHIPSVISFVFPTIFTLLEAITMTWIWFDYQRAGFPMLSFSKSIAAFLITEGVLSIIILIGMCVANVYRARYPTELVDLHFSIEALAYCFILVFIQLPSNFVAYAYIVRFKAPSQPLPVSFIIKPISTFLSWCSFMMTSTPKVPRYILLLKNCCFRIHTAALLLPLMIFPPILSILQTVCTVMLAQNAFLADSFNHKLNEIDDTVLTSGSSLSNSLQPLNNYYSTIYGSLLQQKPGLARTWFSTRIENCVQQETLDKITGMGYQIMITTVRTFIDRNCEVFQHLYPTKQNHFCQNASIQLN